MEDVWYARDTTPAAVEAAMLELLSRRHRESSAFVPARVLNLVAIVDAAFRGEVENRLERVGRFHPSRVVLCAVRPGKTTLDALATVSSDVDEPAPGQIAVVRERLVLEMGPRHLRSLDTIVDPVVVRDIATVVWAPHGHREGVESLRRLAKVVMVDSQDEPVVHEALERAEDLLHSAYVVDLAWLRSTPWRERVAAAFDPPPMRRALGELTGVTVRHRHDSVAAGFLFCGWMASRLAWRPAPLVAGSEALTGRLRGRRTEVEVRLVAVPMASPGLHGVTLETASGEAISLDRAPGGLRAVRRRRDGSEQSWTVLGASRGEAGILGEGVRQALLRDRTYKPALDAARAMAA